jgi:hypothetical protein
MEAVCSAKVSHISRSMRESGVICWVCACVSAGVMGTARYGAMTSCGVSLNCYNKTAWEGRAAAPAWRRCRRRTAAAAACAAPRLMPGTCPRRHTLFYCNTSHTGERSTCVLLLT